MRAPKSHERALWRHATRDVRRLREHAEPEAVELSAPPEIARAAPRRASVPQKLGTGIDRHSAQRLRRGETPLEARLDLHGMTQAEAHEALVGFVARCQAAGMRAVLVITGKSGVLHGAVPRWLEEGNNRARILASAPAQARHGGAGALYLLLRKQR